MMGQSPPRPSATLGAEGGREPEENGDEEKPRQPLWSGAGQAGRRLRAGAAGGQLLPDTGRRCPEAVALPATQGHAEAGRPFQGSCWLGDWGTDGLAGPAR